MITEEDVRFASPTQLAEFLGVYQEQVSRWTAGSPYSDTQLDPACKRFGVSKAVLVEGIELRRQDYRHKKSAKVRMSGLLGGD